MELDESEKYLIDFYRSLNSLRKNFFLSLIKVAQRYIEQSERERKSKQKKGIMDAKERGIKFGRPVLKRPDGYKEIAEKYLNAELSAREAAAMLKVSQTTFLKWFNEDFRSEGRIRTNEGVQSMGQR